MFKVLSLRLTLHKYIFREICSIFFASLLVFIFIIMASRMMGIIELLINERVYPIHVLKIIVCLMPSATIFSLPVTCLMCVLLTFLRLSSDNEIVAIHSSGISLYQILPPVIFFSLISYLIASLIAIFGIPWGNRSYKDVIFQIVESKADVVIKERIFYKPFEDVVFYVSSFSAKDRTMKDLFVVDKRDRSLTNTIVAEKGKIQSNPSSKIINIHFIDGTIFTVDKDFKTARTIKFDTYDLNIDLKEIISFFISREKKPKEMSINELIHELKTSPSGSLRYNQMGIKLFEMFSIPMAIFFMGLIGAPLGSQVRSRGRSKGIVISLVIFFIYYVSLMSVRYVCEMGVLPPWFGIWIPNLFLIIISIYLLRRVVNDRPILFFERFSLKRLFPEQIPSLQVNNHKAISYDEVEYIGNLRAHKFHRSDCRWVEKISPGNRVAFSSSKEASDQGYIPCNLCKP